MGNPYQMRAQAMLRRRRRGSAACHRAALRAWLKDGNQEDPR
jgi:hypothetical protein